MTGDPLGRDIPPPQSPDEAVALLRVPAIGLYVTAAFGVVAAVVTPIVQPHFMDWYFGWLESMVRGQPGAEEQFAAQRQQLQAQMQMMAVFNWVGAAFGVLASAFIAFTAHRMTRLRGWPICIAGAVVAVAPCVSPCCCIGLPIGIWALVRLNDPAVKSAFDRAQA